MKKKKPNAIATWARYLIINNIHQWTTPKECHHNLIKCILMDSHTQVSVSHQWCIHMACQWHHTAFTEVIISIMSIEKKDLDLDHQFIRVRMWASKSNNRLHQSMKIVVKEFKVLLKGNRIWVDQSSSKLTPMINMLTKNKTSSILHMEECSHPTHIQCLHRCTSTPAWCLHNLTKCHITLKEMVTHTISQILAEEKAWIWLQTMETTTTEGNNVQLTITRFKCLIIRRKVEIRHALKIISLITKRAQETEMLRKIADSTTLFSNSDLRIGKLCWSR